MASARCAGLFLTIAHADHISFPRPRWHRRPLLHPRGSQLTCSASRTEGVRSRARSQLSTPRVTGIWTPADKLHSQLQQHDISTLPEPAARLGWRQALRAVLHSPHDSAILSLAGPALLALAADPLLSMVDTAFVGQIGQNELAALGINASLFSFAFVVFNFLSVATTPTIAAAVSAGKLEQVGQVTYQAAAIAVALGIGVAAGLIIYADQALQLMGVDASDMAMLELAKSYLCVRAVAAPAVLLTTVGQGAFRGLADMRTPLAITLATNLVHLALDPLLMFQLHLGLQGAAISTAASEGLAAALYMGMLWQRRQQLGLWPPPALDLARAGQQYLPLLQASSAVLMRTGVLLGAKTLASATAARLGPTCIASHQVMYQVWMLSSMMVDSLAVSGQTLVAVAMGRKDLRAARQISNRLLQLGLGLGSCLALSAGAAAPLWPHLFTSDPSVLAGIQQVMPTAVMLLPVNSLVYTLDGILVGASDFRYMMVAMVVVSGGAMGLLAMVDSQHWGLQGVWTAMSALMLGRLLTLGARYQSQQGPLPPSALKCLESLDDAY